MKLEEIASQVREDFENKQIDKKLLEKLYLNYTNVPDIKSFLSEAERTFPKLNCGLASALLCRLIPNSKIVKGKFNGVSHTFVIASESDVIDITADQYGGPKIYVGPLVEPWSL